MPTVVLLGGNNHDVLFVTQDFNTSDTTTMRDLILTNFTAGLPEQNLVQNFSAYPNPATDLVNISFEALQGADFTMQLTDLSGKIVQSFEREKLNKGLIEKHIDLSGLPVGTYLLNLQMNETLITEKIHVVR
jgi:hypothetical protein